MVGTYHSKEKGLQSIRFNSSLFSSQLLLIAASALTYGYTYANDTRDKLLNDIYKDLKQGSNVIVYQMTNKDKSTEQYADWSAYLNDFSANTTGKYKVYEANAAFNEKLAHSNISTNGDYTVFLRNGFNSYFYEGVIVESMVYMAVDNQYQGIEITDMDRAFLPAVILTVMP